MISKFLHKRNVSTDESKPQVKQDQDVNTEEKNEDEKAGIINIQIKKRKVPRITSEVVSANESSSRKHVSDKCLEHTPSFEQGMNKKSGSKQSVQSNDNYTFLSTFRDQSNPNSPEAKKASPSYIQLKRTSQAPQDQVVSKFFDEMDNESKLRKKQTQQIKNKVKDDHNRNDQISKYSLDPTNAVSGKTETETADSAMKLSAFLYPQSQSPTKLDSVMTLSNNCQSVEPFQTNLNKVIRESKLKNPLESSITNRSSVNQSQIITSLKNSHPQIKEVDSNEEKESSSNSNNEIVTVNQKNASIRLFKTNILALKRLSRRKRIKTAIFKESQIEDSSISQSDANDQERYMTQRTLQQDENMNQQAVPALQHQISLFSDSKPPLSSKRTHRKSQSSIIQKIDKNKQFLLDSMDFDNQIQQMLAQTRNIELIQQQNKESSGSSKGAGSDTVIFETNSSPNNTPPLQTTKQKPKQFTNSKLGSPFRKSNISLNGSVLVQQNQSNKADINKDAINIDDQMQTKIEKLEEEIFNSLAKSNIDGKEHVLDMIYQQLSMPREAKMMLPNFKIGEQLQDQFIVPSYYDVIYNFYTRQASNQNQMGSLIKTRPPFQPSRSKKAPAEDYLEGPQLEEFNF